MKPDIKDFLIEGFKKLGLKQDDELISKISFYFNLLLSKNEVINLISAKQDLKTKVSIHLLDSISPLLWTGLPDAAESMDFGSGGGLPAIPLSIIKPKWNYTLVESTGKKISFLSEVKDNLKLNNIQLINCYLDANKNIENNFYELITARGVSSLDSLISIAGPRLKNNGIFIAYKGPQASQELIKATSVLKKWSMRLIDRLDFRLPLVGAERVLLFFKRFHVKH